VIVRLPVAQAVSNTAGAAFVEHPFHEGRVVDRARLSGRKAVRSLQALYVPLCLVCHGPQHGHQSLVSFVAHALTSMGTPVDAGSAP